MIKACTEWLVATVGYWIRPYDMLADRLRWRWQEPQRCGLPDGIRLVGIDDDGEAHYVSVELANAEAKADILTGGRWVVEYGTSDAAGGFWPNSPQTIRLDSDTAQRRVWRGPVEPIEKPARIDSERSGVRESTDDPNVA